MASEPAASFRFCAGAEYYKGLEALPEGGLYLFPRQLRLKWVALPNLPKTV